MSRSLKWRLLIILGIMIAAGILVYPTLRLATLSEGQKAAMSEAELNALQDKAIKLGLDLRGGMHLIYEVDDSELEEGTDLKNVLDRAQLIIRNRVDKFGQADPIIQQQGDNRLLIQLAGITDEKRAKQLVGQTALLEFKLVREGDEFRRLLADIDEALADTIRALTAEEDEEDLQSQLDEMAADTDTTGLRKEIDDLVEFNNSL